MSFEAGPQHALLARMVGAWEGPTMTWLDPSGLPDGSSWKGRVERVLDGRFVRFTYTGTVGGKPHAGELLLGWEKSEAQWTATWIDSFHTGTGVIVFHGTGDVFDVQGTYPAGPQRWGWRIRITQDTPDDLALEHWNIEPGGSTDRAITTRMKRQAA